MTTITEALDPLKDAISQIHMLFHPPKNLVTDKGVESFVLDTVSQLV
jgi:hypothetical protein